MKKKNLRDSIFESGILDGKLDQLDAFKKEYQREYKQEYNKDFASRTKRKALIFSLEQFSYLEGQAKAYDMKLATFLKSVIFSHLNSTYLSHDKESISNIEYLLRRIQDHLSNTAPHLFSNENALSEIQNLKDQIRELDEFTRDALKNFPLEKWLKSNIENDELFLQKLLSAVAKYIC